MPHIVPGWVVKNPPAKEEMCGFDLWSGGSPGEENGNPLQYSCLENLIYRGAWQATVHEVAKELNMKKKLKNKTKQNFFTTEKNKQTKY